MYGAEGIDNKNITIEQRNIKNVAIVAKKRSSHVAMILLIIFVSVICLFILSLDHATKAFQEKQQRIAEEKEQQEILLKRQYAEKQRQERLERRKNREKQVEKFDAQAHQHDNFVIIFLLLFGQSNSLPMQITHENA